MPNKMQRPGRWENALPFSRKSSSDGELSQTSTETPFDLCDSSDLPLLHWHAEIRQRKGSLKRGASKLGLAFIHTHSSTLRSPCDPHPLGWLCLNRPGGALHEPQGSHLRSPPWTCSATWSRKRTRVERHVTEAADPEDAASAWQVTHDEPNRRAHRAPTRPGGRWGRRDPHPAPDPPPANQPPGQLQRLLFCFWTHTPLTQPRSSPPSRPRARRRSPHGLPRPQTTAGPRPPAPAVPQAAPAARQLPPPAQRDPAPGPAPRPGTGPQVLPRGTSQLGFHGRRRDTRLLPPTGEPGPAPGASAAAPSPRSRLGIPRQKESGWGGGGRTSTPTSSMSPALAAAPSPPGRLWRARRRPRVAPRGTAAPPDSGSNRASLWAGLCPRQLPGHGKNAFRGQRPLNGEGGGDRPVTRPVTWSGPSLLPARRGQPAGLLPANGGQ